MPSAAQRIAPIGVLDFRVGCGDPAAFAEVGPRFPQPPIGARDDVELATGVPA